MNYRGAISDQAGDGQCHGQAVILVGFDIGTLQAGWSCDHETVFFSLDLRAHLLQLADQRGDAVGLFQAQFSGFRNNGLAFSLSCGDGEYCEYPPAALCGAADATGVCKPFPDNCVSLYDPVCGCDDKTYGNDCSAHMAGVSVAHHGTCDSPRCGGLEGLACRDGEFCNLAGNARWQAVRDALLGRLFQLWDGGEVDRKVRRSQQERSIIRSVAPNEGLL